ncbi:MAG: hypothetical protein L6R40_000416 [Gallowayella cf. fulva]|nr:MAG: hypothetical protein L6R40_000416 [Xanthomendoza cf. fulva]
MSSTPSGLDDPFQASPAVPSIVKSDPVSTSLPTPPSSQSNSGTSTDTDDTPNPSHLARPQLVSRKSSGTNIIPREAPTAAPPQNFPPDDARAMSPRRSSEETDKMLVSARLSIERRAQDMQSGLDAIATQIETVSKNCESLDQQNQALQDAIGDMTRSLSRESLSSKKK